MFQTKERHKNVNKELVGSGELIISNDSENRCNTAHDNSDKNFDSAGENPDEENNFNKEESGEVSVRLTEGSESSLQEEDSNPRSSKRTALSPPNAVENTPVYNLRRRKTLTPLKISSSSESTSDEEEQRLSKTTKERNMYKAKQRKTLGQGNVSKFNYVFRLEFSQM